MAQAFPNAFNVDASTSNNQDGANPYGADAWLEPWLCKHSAFYRKHLTRDGRMESKSARRGSLIEAESRKNSVATLEKRRDSEGSDTSKAEAE